MISKIFFLAFLFFITAYAQDFKVASYNVENLFDLKYDKTEYNEYIPNNKSNWNKKTYAIKLQNISKVINELDSDILALQEIESQEALNDLLNYLPQYKYSSFIKNKKSSIGLAVISKYPIIHTKRIEISSDKNYLRPIQEVLVNIKDKKIIIFNNHWRSKRGSENERIEYALSLQNYLKAFHNTIEYILVGDFNSNYNEFQTFINDKKLNNTYGITGINQVLNTTMDNKFVTKENILDFKKIVHYNLWIEKDFNNRFSYKYKGESNTPDNILLSASLFDNQGISYINNSFNVFKPSYLYKNDKISRWKIKGKNRTHEGIGFSDHLPIYASFSTNKIFGNEHIKKKKIISISDLYAKDNLNETARVYNATVIYKHHDNAIIKQKDNRAIYIYKAARDLKIGSTYDIDIQKITTYNGLKEVTQIKKSFLKKDKVEYASLYLSAQSIDILNLEYQNEIITNLQATFEKGFLYYQYNNKKYKIKLYSKDISFLPKNGQKINIITGHLGFYKSKPQIIIYKKSDISVN